MSFHDFRIHFFLAVDSIPLSKHTTFYLSIHLLKDILIASKWAIMKKAILNICTDFCMFSTPWGKYQGGGWLHFMVRVYLIS